RLEQSVGGMRRFTADASHELRTPLAALMGELEITLRKPRSADELRTTVEGTLEKLGDLARLVESLLALARAGASALPLNLAEVEVGPLVRRAAEPYEAVLAARGIELRWQEEPLVARVDPLWIGRVIANLFDNACKFVPDGGWVEVKIKDGVEI